jgi:septal ring factor EnvC (AmiA/AmiB activator)
VGIAAILDKAGPSLASGIVLAILAAAGSSALAWRDLLSTSDVRFSVVTAELERLRAEFDAFRNPGGRFTKHDGDRVEAQIARIDERLHIQEQRPPRLNPALEEAMKTVDDIEHRVTIIEQSVQHISAEQERLCQRLMACNVARQRQ